jgi:hypothetical protein
LTNHCSFLNFGEFPIKGAVQLRQNKAAAEQLAEKIGFSFRH